MSNLNYVRHDTTNTAASPQPGSTTVTHFDGTEGWTERQWKDFNGDYQARKSDNTTRTPGTYQARNSDNTTRTPSAYQRHGKDNNVVSDGAVATLVYNITNSGGTFNLRSTGTVNYNVDWNNDESYESSTSNTLAHTYSAGNHFVRVYSNDVYRPFFTNVSADVDQITSVVIGAGADLGTDLISAWRGGDNIASFVCPFNVTSGVTSFGYSWTNCSSLTSFPLIDTSSATNFTSAWRGCSSLTSFPSIDTSSATIFGSAWNGCTSLADFPANVFDTTGTLSANAFKSTWTSCALTAQSIENILVSLDTNGASNITLGINGGTNASKTTWSTAANAAYTNLIAKNWSISYNA